MQSSWSLNGYRICVLLWAILFSCLGKLIVMIFFSGTRLVALDIVNVIMRNHGGGGLKISRKDKNSRELGISRVIEISFYTISKKILAQRGLLSQFSDQKGVVSASGGEASKPHQVALPTGILPEGTAPTTKWLCPLESCQRALPPGPQGTFTPPPPLTI